MRFKLAAAVLFVATTAQAQTTQPTPGGGPRPTTQTLFRQEAFVVPPYAPLRWNEDYSYLKDPSKSDDYLDPLKYIPLGQPDIYLSLGGQARQRYEHFNHNTFGSGPQDRDGYHLTRLLAHGDLHVGENVRFYVEGKSSLENGREGGPRTSDEDEAELQQAFADVRLPWSDAFSTTVRAGRQELYFGAGRVIDQIEWSNVRRTFDGVRIMNPYRGDGWSNSLDLLLFRPVLVEPYQFNNDDSDRVFGGVYDTLFLPNLIDKAESKFDFYLLSQSTRRSAVTSMDAETYMAGTRFYTNPKPLDLDIEAGYQFGNRASADVQAGFFATEVGWFFQTTGVSPRPFLAFDYSTGDAPGSGYTRYNPLYPSGHRYIGQIDNFERVNLMVSSAGLDLVLVKDAEFAKRVAFRAQYLAFWRTNSADGIYNSSNTALARPSTATREGFVGQEIDLILSWQVDRHILLSSGYSHLFAGPYIHDSDGGNNSLSRDIDFLYFQAQYTF